MDVINLRALPKDLREVNRLLFDLNRGVKTNGTRTYAADQRFLNTIATANSNSAQSVSPLTASDAGSTVEIAIAAHSVQFGFGPVAYNSGTISGLDYSTKYWVYADDANLEGGAVTYLATTNALNAISNNDRYRVGSVTTPAAAGPPNGGGYGGGGGNGGFPLP